MEEEKTSIGTKLAYCRKKAGLSQEQMAEVMNVQAKTIYKYENDITEPSLKFLFYFSMFMEIPMEEFVDDYFTLDSFKYEYPKFHFGRFINDYKLLWG